VNVPQALAVSGWLVTPTVVLAAVFHGPRVVTAAHRALTRRRQADLPVAAPVPIEELAHRLRRLMEEHDAVSSRPEAAFRVHHLWALQAAIGDCALDAAEALGVPRPQLSPSRPLTQAELGRLLRALAATGLVLPSRSALLLAGLAG
jgi:hypothetical protein